jgi:preprotein translocase subunit SecD
MQIPVWKRIFVWGLCALALLFAAPNLFYSRVEKHNDAVLKIEKNGETPELAADKALWPSWAPSGLVNLGLDLRGGAHLLGEVHVEDVYKARMDGLWPELRDALAAERDTVGAIRRVQAPEASWRSRSANPTRWPKAVEIARGLAARSPR